jgi:fatty-acid desaturase
MQISRKTHHLLIFAISHVLYIFYIYFLGLDYFAATLIIGIFTTNITIGLYIHRVLGHKMYKIPDKAHKVFLCLTSFLNLGSAAISASVHRNHHIYSDTDKDPHYVYNIGLFSFLIKDWGYRYKPHKNTFMRIVRNKDVLKQHKHHLSLGYVSAFTCPFLPVCSFWFLNFHFLFNHNRNGPKNIKWAYPILLGEELHRDHHINPSKRKMHKFDLIHYLGKTLEYFSQSRP